MPGHDPVGLQHPLAQRPADAALDGQDHDRDSQRYPADGPRGHRKQGPRGYCHGAQAQPGPWAPSRRRQGGQRVGPDARRHLLAEKREIFPEVEAGCQLPHGGLPLADRRGISGGAQPGGQRLLAARGPRAAQKLVERALAEDVEIVGVRMVRIEKTRAALPDTGPLTVEPRQPALVERTAVLGAAAALADARVDGSERQKRRGRNHQPPPKEPPEAGQRRDQQRDERHAEPGPGDRLLEPPRLRRAFPVSLHTALVLRSRSGLSLGHRWRASRAAYVSAGDGASGFAVLSEWLRDTADRSDARGLEMGDVGLMGMHVPGMSWRQIRDAAVLAEELGYSCITMGESWGEDALTSLAQLAAVTTRIRIGSSIVPVFARSPANLAMTALNMDRMSQGRFFLGLGTSGRLVIEDFHGEKFAKPLTRMREYIDIVRKAARGERLDHDGEFFHTKRFQLRFPPFRANLPIYIAALSPPSLRLTGELADGWLPIFLAPARMAAAVVELKAGAEGAGRTLHDITISPQVSIYVTDNVAAARDRERPHIAFYIGGMGVFYHAVHASDRLRRRRRPRARGVFGQGPRRRGQAGHRRDGRRGHHPRHPRSVPRADAALLRRGRAGDPAGLQRARPGRLPEGTPRGGARGLTRPTRGAPRLRRGAERGQAGPYRGPPRH